MNERKQLFKSTLGDIAGKHRARGNALERTQRAQRLVQEALSEVAPLAQDPEASPRVTKIIAHLANTVITLGFLLGEQEPVGKGEDL